jgi:RimJ/RimL family protein N-acetyltransferase
MNNYNFRLLEKNELQWFVDLRNSVRHNLHDSRIFSKEDALAWYENNKKNYWVIYFQLEKIGYFRLLKCDCGIYSIGADISPVYQGKGFGYQSYLNFAKDILLPMNITYLSLRVKRKNEIAIKLYTKLGFQVENFVNQDSEDIVMISSVQKILGLPS